MLGGTNGHGLPFPIGWIRNWRFLPFPGIYSDWCKDLDAADDIGPPIAAFPLVFLS